MSAAVRADVRYPLHNPGGPGHLLRSVHVCAQPLVPPECAPPFARPAFRTELRGRLVCPDHGLVEATPEQVEQARAAARADGTWPEARS